MFKNGLLCFSRLESFPSNMNLAPKLGNHEWAQDFISLQQFQNSTKKLKLIVTLPLKLQSSSSRQDILFAVFS